MANGEANAAARRRRWGSGPAVLIALLTAIILVAVFADWLAPHAPDATSLRNRLKPPFWLERGSMTYILGTDDQGRDVLSRVIHGTRVSLAVAFFAVACAGSIGIALGMIAGYVGGKIDALIMRITDAATSVPLILVALLFVVTLGQSFVNVILALAILLWSRYTRVIRSEVLSLKERDFVVLARVAGCSHLSIIARHILPNVVNTALVLLTLQVGIVILVEATLSFLGAGVPPPTPAWGSMVSEGRDYVASEWWIAFFPGVAILITVLSFNLVGDWLRDRFDPKLRQL
jgi:peptide/nickel transport system permease protein